MESSLINGVKNLSDLKYGTYQERIGDKISNKIYEYFNRKPYKLYEPIKIKKMSETNIKNKSDVKI